MKKSLTKKERLKKTQDIKQLFQSSLRQSCRGMKIVYKRNGLSWNRMTVTLVRKYGNAVVRNRSKRQIREIYRNIKHRLQSGWDMVIILYPGDYTYEDRKSQVFLLLQKAHILVETDT
ncbi:MAG: ribonuclease P protein component [Spirochaetia bacterium]